MSIRWTRLDAGRYRSPDKTWEICQVKGGWAIVTNVFEPSRDKVVTSQWRPMKLLRDAKAQVEEWYERNHHLEA